MLGQGNWTDPSAEAMRLVGAEVSLSIDFYGNVIDLFAEIPLVNLSSTSL